jgi:hypothetical protein
MLQVLLLCEITATFCFHFIILQNLDAVDGKYCVTSSLCDTMQQLGGGLRWKEGVLRVRTS